MQYLKPIEILQAQLRNAQILVVTLVVCLGVAFIVVPRLSALGNPVLVQTDPGARLASVQPWKASIARLESFARAYLGARFDWNEEKFSERREQLHLLTDESTFSKFKESLAAFENLAKSQKTRSYYILEQVRFSNGDEKLSADVTRVLRVRNVAFATPISVTLTYQNAPITEQNPFGMIVTGVKEVENETH